MIGSCGDIQIILCIVSSPIFHVYQWGEGNNQHFMLDVLYIPLEVLLGFLFMFVDLNWWIIKKEKPWVEPTNNQPPFHIQKKKSFLKFN